MFLNEEKLITTDRLLLRLFDPEQSEVVFNTFSDTDLIEYFGIVSADGLILEKERFKHGLTMFGKSFSYFHLLEKNSGNVIGWCGFHTWYTRHSRAEIGYELNNDIHKGKGLMKEALSPIIKFGFEKMNLHRIEAYTSTENSASMNLLLKNGFQKEGLLREHYFTKGKFDDSVAFALLKSEFLKRTLA